MPRSEQGVTLIELLVAMGAMGLVLVYTLGTFAANRNTYVVIENLSEAHQNMLAIASLIERDIRTAGYMVPPATAACGVDATNGPDTLFVSDAEAIVTAESLAAGLAGTELGSTAVSIPGGWGTPQQIDLDDILIDQQPSYDTDATPGADSDFQLDGGAIFFDPNDPENGVYCGIVTAVDAANDKITISLAGGLATAPAGGAGWLVVPAHVYRINGNALERNGVVMARNVEDLQVAWFYDLDEDGQLDANENFGAGGTEPNLDNGQIGPAPGADPGLLREIRFNLVLRTADDDPQDNTVGIGQVRENRTNPAPADGFRRRVHTATIRLRNIAT